MEGDMYESGQYLRERHLADTYFVIYDRIQCVQIDYAKGETTRIKKAERNKRMMTEKNQGIDLKLPHRKFQVSNGYLLEFDQLARILNSLLVKRDKRKINRAEIMEDTGFAERQVETLVSMGAAMGLIKPGKQVLSPIGLLIAEHDIFIEDKASLEWCHYIGASTYKNLFWFDIFNHLLIKMDSLTQDEWNEFFRGELATKYTKRTIGKGIYEEVRFIVDAYFERNFKKLELLQRTSDGRLYRRRYTHFTPLTLAAMIYDFCAKKSANLCQIEELAVTPGSPALVFSVDTTTLRQQVGKLHEHGWLRYETTHNLDQVRLKYGYSALEFLIAYYEERKPRILAEPPSGELFE
jgi:hypothetical protein